VRASDGLRFCRLNCYQQDNIKDFLDLIHEGFSIAEADEGLPVFLKGWFKDISQFFNEIMKIIGEGDPSIEKLL